MHREAQPTGSDGGPSSSATLSVASPPRTPRMRHEVLCEPADDGMGSIELRGTRPVRAQHRRGR
jgi:hypothetical protein